MSIIPRLRPDEALIIADGGVTIVSRAELERLKLGDTGIPDPPIASIVVPEDQLDEALARVLALLAKDEDGGV
jgi:hypothetical protein